MLNPDARRPLRRTKPRFKIAKVLNLEAEIRGLGENSRRTIAGLQDAVEVTQASVVAAKESASGAVNGDSGA